MQALLEKQIMGADQGHPPKTQSNTQNGYDDANSDYIVKEGEFWNNRFHIHRLIGKGSFGQVVEATDTVNQEKVAIKIIKNKTSFARQAEIEMRIVRFLNSKDPDDTKNIRTDYYFIAKMAKARANDSLNFTVRIKEHFFYKNHLCIVYEMLSFNLYEVLRKGGFQGLPISLVRKFAGQILVTLEFLTKKDIQIIHCDLKPEK